VFLLLQRLLQKAYGAVVSDHNQVAVRPVATGGYRATGQCPPPKKWANAIVNSYHFTVCIVHINVSSCPRNLNFDTPKICTPRTKKYCECLRVCVGGYLSYLSLRSLLRLFLRPVSCRLGFVRIVRYSAGQKKPRFCKKKFRFL